MWARAFLEQARSDWQMWQHIHSQKLPGCHELHYLQMTCEKLGKAFLIAGRSLSPQQAKASHVAFKRFLQVAARNPALQRLMEMTALQSRTKKFYRLFAKIRKDLLIDAIEAKYRMVMPQLWVDRLRRCRGKRWPRMMASPWL